jgi:hypothetical protein
LFSNRHKDDSRGWQARPDCPGADSGLAQLSVKDFWIGGDYTLVPYESNLLETMIIPRQPPQTHTDP